MTRRLLWRSAGGVPHSDGILAGEVQLPGEDLLPLTIPHVATNLLSLQEPGPGGGPEVELGGGPLEDKCVLCASSCTKSPTSRHHPQPRPPHSGRSAPSIEEVRLEH